MPGVWYRRTLTVLARLVAARLAQNLILKNLKTLNLTKLEEAKLRINGRLFYGQLDSHLTDLLKEKPNKDK